MFAPFVSAVTLDFYYNVRKFYCGFFTLFFFNIREKYLSGLLGVSQNLGLSSRQRHMHSAVEHFLSASKAGWPSSSSVETGNGELKLSLYVQERLCVGVSAHVCVRESCNFVSVYSMFVVQTCACMPIHCVCVGYIIFLCLSLYV